MFKRKFVVPRPAGQQQQAQSGIQTEDKENANESGSGSQLTCDAPSTHTSVALAAPYQKPTYRPKVAAVPTLPAAHSLDPLASEAQDPGGSKSYGSLSGESNVFKVLYVKQEQFFKKKAAKVYLDGVLQIVLATNQGTLFNSDGKAVWRGAAKHVSGPGAAGPSNAAFMKRLQMSRESNKKKQSSQKRKWQDADDGSGDEGEDETVRYELSSWIAEVEQKLDPAQFSSGECFVKAGALPVGPRGAAAQGALSWPKPFQAPSSTAPAPSSQAAAIPQKAVKYLHDPSAPGAVLLNAEQWAAEGAAAGAAGQGKSVCPVVVDPYLGRSLRPHQVEGVQFMYRCILESSVSQGCILADEMGLGKTLQVITLIWTLLRQGPTGRAAVKKVIVVTPATLVKQWVKEVTKWLGAERLKAVALTQGPDSAAVISDFCTLSSYHTSGMMVTSYETLRRHSKSLQDCCDLLICDEAHRLKSIGGNKTVESLLQLNCSKRILLSGTPVQNNLDEFYALLAFVAPGLLGNAGMFKRVFSDPISRGRDKSASEQERRLGEDRARELGSKVSSLVLRRTQDLLVKHLPPLSQWVLFCKLSALQLQLYRDVLDQVAATASGEEDNSLALISCLRKLCNSPALLCPSSAAGDEEQQEEAGLGGTGCRHKTLGAWASGLAPRAEASDVQASGKLQVLSCLLASMTARGQRCVVVSTSTAALDLIDRIICQEQGYRTVRIDGATGMDERQSIVDNFNMFGVGQVFLLSTRAGGAGLNLVGASNLVLYDSDWNPAADLQAMARIWRDGQKLACNVYRLLTTSTIEEKVYQRQIMKSDLATATIDVGNQTGRQLTRDDLRRLFRPPQAVERDCETRTLLLSSDHQPLVWLDLEKPHVAGEEAEKGGECLASALALGLVTAVGKVVRAAPIPAEALKPSCEDERLEPEVPDGAEDAADDDGLEDAADDDDLEDELDD